MKNKNAYYEKLFEKYIQNQSSKAELNELFSFLAEKENELLFNQWMANYNQPLTNDFKLESAHHDQLRNAIQKKIRDKRRHSASYFIYRVAAVISIALIVGTIVHKNQIKQSIKPAIASVRRIEVHTNYGEKKQLRLSDGTIVYLNSGSTFCYPDKFQNKNREVQLDGEAFFKVKHDASHPFIIHSNQVVTTVLGTSFLVKSFKDMATQVAVVTGRVKVQHAGDKVFLLPNHKAVFNPTTESLTAVDANSNELISWTKGTLVLNGPWAKCKTELERWYGVKVILKDEELKTSQVNGSYHNEKLKNVLESICFMFQINYTQQNDTVFLMK